MSSMTYALQQSIVRAAILDRQAALGNGSQGAAFGASAATRFIAALNAGTAVAADAWPLLQALGNNDNDIAPAFVATLAASH